MLQHNKWFAATLLVLAVTAMGQIGGVKVYACDLTDLGSCLSGTTNPYVAGPQDAVYDSSHGLAYHPMAACCHSDDYNQQFAQGYNAEWNQYQSQSANVNVENSPGAVISVNQKSNQDQGPSISSCVRFFVFFALFCLDITPLLIRVTYFLFLTSKIFVISPS